MTRYKFILLVFLPLVMLHAHDEKRLTLNQINPYFENDFFAIRDRYYTVGWKVAAIFERRAESPIAFPFRNEKTKYHYMAFTMGQQVFTPRNQATTELLKDDRPYAGWLYGSAAWHQLNGKTITSAELQLGTIGPRAGGENVMNIFHSLIGNKLANGWANQLHNEWGIVLAMEKKWRFMKSDLPYNLQGDVIPFAGGTLGNIHTYANAGVQFRLGWNLPDDMGAARIRPAAEHALRIYPVAAHSGWQSYFLAGVETQLVARNIFLDGNTFKASHSIEKNMLVGYFSAGWILCYKSFQFSYTHYFVTKEFKRQSITHQFASLVFSWVF